ncbi:MAT1-1-2 [Ilyonectria sp. MPI-CAGE-AT-0026]|nr:MAT1-1-2 [Ilyonectria sp. MPI-CAGE-AT-0026]
MDNLLFYRPLWEEKALATSSSKHLENLRLDIMEKLLHALPMDVKPPTATAVVTSSIEVIKTLFKEASGSNDVLQTILDHSQEADVDPNLLLRGAIVLWFTSASPILSRDPYLGLPPKAMSGGGLTFPWVQRLAEKNFFIGNLGYLSMLMTAESWEKPSHPKLQVATLMANGIISFLFATFVIAPHLKTHPQWRQYITNSETRGHKEMTVFLKTTWQVSREGWEKFDHPPGAEFSALNTEVKMSRDGRNLLTRVGRPGWHVAPYWHPFRVVPGSPWNKFIRNRRQKIFQIFPTLNNRVQYMVPGSAATLTSSCEAYYGVLRSQFDSTNTRRARLSDQARNRQFWRLAEGTGLQYPTVRPTEQNSSNIHDYGRAEHMYNVPLIKKPASDISGNLTPPFLTTTARALRFAQEPESVDEDFYAMIFSH